MTLTASDTLVAEPVGKGSARMKVYGRLTELPALYEKLFEASEKKSFFLGLDWFRHLAGSILCESEQLRVVGLETNDGLPLFVLPTRYSGQNSVVGRRELSSLANYYSPFYSPLFSEWDQNTQTAVKTLAQDVLSQFPALDVVRIYPLAPESPQFAFLAESFRKAGMIVQDYFCFGNWYLPAEGRSYLEYFATLPSMTRNTVLRKGKKLTASGRGRIEVITDTDGLEDAISAYQKVYAASWKVPEPYPAFIPSLMRLCAQKGCLRLGVVFVDGQPAAAQFWIVSHGTASIYKLAYDEAFADFSVGSILTAKMMEHALDKDKVREIDYLAGDDPYKKQWMSHRRERWGIVAFNPRTVRGSLGIARHIGGRLLKRNYHLLKARLTIRHER